MYILVAGILLVMGLIGYMIFGGAYKEAFVIPKRKWD